jgi:hypothetical protein
MILARDLTLAQQNQRLTRRQVRARRLVEQVVDTVRKPECFANAMSLSLN